MLSGPAAFMGFTAHSTLLLSCSCRQSVTVLELEVMKGSMWYLDSKRTKKLFSSSPSSLYPLRVAGLQTPKLVKARMPFHICRGLLLDSCRSIFLL